MATWAQLEELEPAFAARARAYLEARKHLTLATLRKDGAPRISGTECEIVDGELQFGSMWHSTKALDLLRDPRFALHSGSEDPPEWPGDAKVAGTVRHELANTETHGQHHMFRCDITEVVIVGMSSDKTKLVVEAWHQGRGLERTERT